MNTTFREKLKNKKRIVIKIGSSSLTHEKTGELNLFKIEKLIRVICDEMSALHWLAFFLALFGFVFLRMIFPL